MEYVYEDLTEEEYIKGSPGRSIEQTNKPTPTDLKVHYCRDVLNVEMDKTCFYVIKDGYNYLVGSTNNIVGLFSLEDLRSLFVIVGTKKVYKKNVRREIEQETIDFMKSLGYNVVNQIRKERK